MVPHSATRGFAVLPKFSSESDPILRREMLWNAAALESMATWREYYDETVIPQGTMYDYIWGNMASSRDLAQQALPFCHTNPAIARSTLRFIMKRMLPDGTVQLNDEGFGWCPSGGAANQRPAALLLPAPCRIPARHARRNAFSPNPSATIRWKTPATTPASPTSARRSSFCATASAPPRTASSAAGTPTGTTCSAGGPATIPYNTEFTVGESHMNSAMALVILGDLANAIDALELPEAAELTAAMLEYRSELHVAWNRDLGDRDFPRRAWMDATTPLGEDDMWLEPQGYTLLIPEFSIERKRRLFTQLQNRLLAKKPLARARSKNLRRARELRRARAKMEVSGTPSTARSSWASPPSTPPPRMTCSAA